jgi:hypothetical protein
MASPGVLSAMGAVDRKNFFLKRGNFQVNIFSKKGAVFRKTFFLKWRSFRVNYIRGRVNGNKPAVLWE